MELTIGANQFFWKPDVWSDFYTDMAKAPVDRVVLGELVCSKRLPFYADRIPAAVETLLTAGKQVSLTSLALITLPRERKQAAELAEAGMDIEINDLTMLSYLPENATFSVGPLVNVYNEGTLTWLAQRGATRICLPPELPLTSVTTLARAGADLGVTIEVWAHGRLPLAISGRCYHARLHGRTKDNCQFACEDDPDGLSVTTLEDKPFLAMNGVQTLSESCASMAHHIDELTEAGVLALRLSPQTGDFMGVSQAWRDRLNGVGSNAALADKLSELAQGMRLSDGFLTGSCGADWSGSDAA